MFERYRGFLVLAVALATPIAASAATVETAFAPSNDLALTLEALGSAQRYIELNIYELTSPEITDVLIARIQAGVQVVILNEGQPVGGLSTIAKGVQSEIVQAMSRYPRTDHFYEMTSKAGGKRRFHYDHAKYAVIDGTSVLIGSENYSPTGNPQPGSVGNRGWEVWIQDSNLATHYAQVFASDAVTAAGDVLELTNRSTEAIEGAGPVPAPRFPSYSAAELGVMRFSAAAVTPFTSPDTGLSGLVAVIRSARQTLDIEQMTFNSAWTPTGTTSPLLTEVIAAAKRGVRVRVLLNDETVFNPEAGPAVRPINPVTVQTLNQLGHSGLNVQAKIADVKAMGVDYIHNKGMIVDGVRTLISSINWDANAVLKNREAAVAIDSQEVGAYYSKLFDSDWTASTAPARQQAGSLEPEQRPVAAQAAAAQAAAVLQSCPSELTVKAEIGQLTANDREDLDYLSLSSQTIEGSFVRKLDDRTCFLIERGQTGPISSRHFLELSATRDGSIVAKLDGFTPRTSKAFSVQAKIPSITRVTGIFPAEFFAGSTERERLGPALLNLFGPR